MGSETIRLSREELYDLVWSEPMRTVAKRFDISDVGLAKHCRKLTIPMPGRGYWAKKAANKAVRRIALPKLPPNSAPPGEIVLRPPVSVEEEPPLPPRVAEQVAFEDEHPIKVGAALRSPHPLVRRTIEAFRNNKRRGEFVGNWQEPHLDLHVTRALLPRSLRIADALVKAFELRGWKIELGTDQHRKSFVHLLGQRVAFGIREPTKKVENEPATPRRLLDGTMYTPYQTKYYDEPAGKLSLVIRSQWDGSSAVEHTWMETATHPLEEKLNDFVIGVVDYANTWAEHEVRRQEEARQRWDAEQRRQEEQRRREAEAARVAALERQAERWVISQRLLEYLAAVRAKATQLSDGELEPALSEWLTWAEGYARSINPLNRPLDGLLTLPPRTVPS